MPQAISAAAISRTFDAQLRRIDVDGQRVEVGEEEQALGLILHPHPAQDRAEQIAEVQVAGRLDAGNDAHRCVAHPSTFLRRSRTSMSSLVHAADDPGEREIDEPAGADQRARRRAGAARPSRRNSRRASCRRARWPRPSPARRSAAARAAPPASRSSRKWPRAARRT